MAMKDAWDAWRTGYKNDPQPNLGSPPALNRDGKRRALRFLAKRLQSHPEEKEMLLEAMEAVRTDSYPKSLVMRTLQ